MNKERLLQMIETMDAAALCQLARILEQAEQAEKETSGQEKAPEENHQQLEQYS